MEDKSLIFFFFFLNFIADNSLAKLSNIKNGIISEPLACSTCSTYLDAIKKTIDTNSEVSGLEIIFQINKNLISMYLLPYIERS